MSLTIHTSNKIENLVDALADILKQPLASPFTPEVVVMQSKGMQRWLAMELASRFGVWANCSYPFPNALIAQLYKQIVPDIPATDSYAPDCMSWQIFGLLPGFVDKESFAPLQHYLSDDQEQLKQYQLSQKIADTFDQYTLYRPELLERWEQGSINEQDETWQAILWQELSRQGNGFHRGRLKQLFCKQLQITVPEQGLLPERIALFGVSYLPTYHLEVIAAVARHTDVHLFLLSPTREYWADIISLKGKAGLAPEDQPARFEGNPLLASLGRLGRDFSDLTIELGNLACRDEDLYAEPEGACLLHQLQSDILNLVGAEEDRLLQPVSVADTSIQIHSCHSPMREIEVLQDQLLALMEQEAGFEPRDILVMTPDIEAYAPYITAVFGGVQNPAHRIPFSIADRRLASEGVVASVLQKLLALPGSRLTVVQLLDLLSISPVLRCFDLEEGDLATIRGWLEDTAVRWGMDQQARGRLGLPEYRANSWRAGLERLLLGYAMSDDNGCLFHDKLPYDAMEGASVQLLGKLISFVNRIEQAAEELIRPRSLGDWSLQLRTVLLDFTVADDETSRELITVSGIISALAELGTASGYSGEVTFAVVRAWIVSQLEQEEKGLGFMTGGVTFCAMLPLRSIPFKVIAMIGMNDGAFPRQNLAPGFDLIARHPQRGDRSLRDEDRYLFLETLLSARQNLYISYVGQSVRDNSEIPPSVLVSELLDAVLRSFCSENGKALEQQLVTKHRLQGFSRQYFTAGSPFFSYSEENCTALIEQCNSSGPPVLFMPEQMPEPAEEWRDIPLPRLLRFITNPAQFFLEQRLGIRLDPPVEPLEELEPFAAEGLASYSLKTEMLDLVLQGGDPGQLLASVRSRGILPPAQHGDLLFREHLVDAQKFAEKITREIGDTKPLPHLDLLLELNGFRLHGRLATLWPERMLRYRCAKMKAKDQLKAWIEHLVLNVLQEPDYPCQTLLLMTDRSVLFSPVEEPEEILQAVLELYWQGLSRPLPFFPESALAYASAKPPWDIGKALGKWSDGYRDLPGEGSDRYFRLCFGKTDPFDAEFERIARLLLGPLLQYRS